MDNLGVKDVSRPVQVLLDELRKGSASCGRGICQIFEDKPIYGPRVGRMWRWKRWVCEKERGMYSCIAAAWKKESGAE